MRTTVSGIWYEKMAESKAAQVAFEKDNNIQSVRSVDALFKYSNSEQLEILAKKPWDKE